MPSGQTQRLYRLMDEAAAFYNRDDVEQAYTSACAVLALNADFAPALHLRGLCEWRRGDLAGAVASIRQALRLGGPRDARMLQDLAGVYADRGRWTLAVETLREAIELQPDHAGSHVNLGRAYENLGEHDAAERAYRRGLELDPRSVAAAGNLAALCEEANRLEEADALVRMALALAPGDVGSNLTRAQLLIRSGHNREAAARLESFLARSDLGPRNRAVALTRLGAAREELGDYERAFEAFRDSNVVLQAGAGTASSGAGIYTLETARRIRRHRAALLPSPDTAVATERPAFLVGFPRSGTTLLDQILSSHPRVLVEEEQENLQDLLRDFATSDAGLERFAALSADELDPYRERYRARVSGAARQSLAGRVVVDKYPLNTIFMFPIARLFTGARFIFVVRDPRDVVLSCFKHSFVLNAAMRNFLTLEATVRYYAAVMELGVAALSSLRESVYVLRYEDLVEGLEDEARGLCGFLDLDWDPAMLRFQDTARRRHISTPSYQQVVKPLYTSARGRWRNYQSRLQPFLPQLEPFLECFGYR